MKPFVILMYGPPCSGKSATVEMLMAKHKGLFRVSADRIKWFASGYASGGYRTEVANVVLAITSSALAQGLPVMVEANATILKNMWREYRALAEKNNIGYFEINLEAPLDVLKERLRLRIASSVARRKKITLKDPSDLETRYEVYLAHKKDSIPTFDTSAVPLDEIVEKIEGMVGLLKPSVEDNQSLRT
ncbi:MAG: AAA family ATPase [Burkholderiales bacterium]